MRRSLSDSVLCSKTTRTAYEHKFVVAKYKVDLNEIWKHIEKEYKAAWKHRLTAMRRLERIRRLTQEKSQEQPSSCSEVERR